LEGLAHNAHCSGADEVSEPAGNTTIRRASTASKHTVGKSLRIMFFFLLHWMAEALI
jgi:hypothetical protein